MYVRALRKENSFEDIIGNVTTNILKYMYLLGLLMATLCVRSELICVGMRNISNAGGSALFHWTWAWDKDRRIHQCLK